MILLFMGSLALAKTIDIAGTGALIADSIIGALGSYQFTSHSTQKN
jgi:solute carrier family 13 (sodium-dependent dicarboxylate transporter), member 2/3/5